MSDGVDSALGTQWTHGARRTEQGRAYLAERFSCSAWPASAGRRAAGRSPHLRQSLRVVAKVARRGSLCIAALRVDAGVASADNYGETAASHRVAMQRGVPQLSIARCAPAAASIALSCT
ncbi:hypothetical protein XFF6990_390009 [Xanthomonas citri pv. fuscans]|uniref:Uncharacterized protein n=1 Tax=Xanthomonas campestris pv. phaseoli TaxID=317013 RepID=A0A7Z7IXT3_XANCH|nr:hypothetical protein XFF6990_390009 [Xanthomonas citri pv. fuscans]SOO23586.1 hypothetical protein XFF6991_280245 [Xanthomonas phaseoli pv. phaseoli]